MKKSLTTTFSILFSLLITIVVAYCILTHLYPKEYSEYVERYSKEFGIDENLVYAIIKCESNFNSTSVSHAGAIGLMQITPDTLAWAAEKSGKNNVSHNTLYSPTENIKYGCCIFSLFYKEFKDTELSLACYNAGRGNVLKWLKNKNYSDDGIILKDIPFKETKEYVKRVLNTQKIYELIY